MDFTGFFMGLMLGAITSFVTVGVILYWAYLRMTMRLATIQAEFLAKGASIAKKEAMGVVTTAMGKYRENRRKT